jgi:hypothetical protein
MAYVIIQEFTGYEDEEYRVIGVVSDLYSANKIIDTLKEIQARLAIGKEYPTFKLLRPTMNDTFATYTTNDSAINHFTNEELTILDWMDLTPFDYPAYNFCNSEFKHSEVPFRNPL